MKSTKKQRNGMVKMILVTSLGLDLFDANSLSHIVGLNCLASMRGCAKHT